MVDPESVLEVVRWLPPSGVAPEHPYAVQTRNYWTRVIEDNRETLLSEIQELAVLNLEDAAFTLREWWFLQIRGQGSSSVH